MQKGDFVTINYTARIKDTGKIFDTTIEEVAKKEGIHRAGAVYGAVTIVLGARHVILGLEKALLEMDINEERELDLEPEDAFGKRNPSQVTTILLREFRKYNLLPRVGMRIEINDRWATVRNVSSGRVTLDFNHPLSGRVVHYWVQLLGKVENMQRKVEVILRLLQLKGEVTPVDDGFLIKIEGIEKGKEKRVHTLVKREIEKHVPGIEISFG